MIHTMFPMLGPPRDNHHHNNHNNKTLQQQENKNKNKKNQVKTHKTVRLIDPTHTNSSETIDSNQTIYSNYHNIQPANKPLPLPPSPPPPPPPQQQQKEKLKKDYSSSSINHFPTTLIVISFITRYPLKPNQGQGSELLFYKPKNFNLHSSNSHVSASCISKWTCLKPEDKTKWTFLFIDGERIKEEEEEEESIISEEQVMKLSNRSINRHLTSSLSNQRLIHVRNSKPLRWDSDTILVSCLYLFNNNNNKNNDDWIKVNVESHYWSKINGFHSAIENDLVSTALAAVCFPVAFNVGFEEIAAHDAHIRSDLVTLKALDTLYLSVQAGYARDGFKFYPKSAEPLKKVGNSDRDFKRRIWAYWTEVLCWHLIVCRSIFKVSISYTLHKIMVELKPAVKDDKVNVEELEKLMVKAIGREADRCRQSVDNIVNHTISEILNNPIFSPSITSSNSIHIFTLGSSSATYGVLSQLVKHFVSQSRWKLNLFGEPDKPGLRITIGECRPLHEGVTLARKLNEIIQVYDPIQPGPDNTNQGRAGQDLNQPLGYHDDSNDWYLNSNHQRVVEKFDTPLYMPLLHSTNIQPNQDGQPHQDQGPAKLEDLLKELNMSREYQDPFNLNESGKIKVSIEITTDAGLSTSLLNADHTGILLLSADRVLSNGDALCKLGSSYAAYTAWKKKQIVIILVRHDRIEANYSSSSSSSSSEEEEEESIWKDSTNTHKKKKKKKKSLIERQTCWDDSRHIDENNKINQAHPLITSSLILSWKSMFKPDLIDTISKKTQIAPIPITQNKNHFHNHLLHFDIVEANWISFFITDSGTIGLERIKQVSKTLTSLTRLLWEEEEEDFI